MSYVSISQVDKFIEASVESTFVIENYQKIRSCTEEICAHLHSEDSVVQTMEDISPPKWHLGHTTWFFERFLLIPFLRTYQPYSQTFNELFNSYYKSAGEHIHRSNRGFLSRPLLKDIYSYRAYVDQAIQQLLLDKKIVSNEIKQRLELGLNHEQQHQELLLTDIKHIFFSNPTFPIYQLQPFKRSTTKNKKKLPQYIQFEGGLTTIGAKENIFAYDNEFPQHKYYLNSFSLRDLLVTNEEYLTFMEDGGYQKPEYWLSDAWDIIEKEKWKAPLYWVQKEKYWYEYRLKSFDKLDLNSPVCHVSFFETDAFARWSKKRLPTEFEWEFASQQSCSQDITPKDNFLDNDYLHPTAENTVQAPSTPSLLGNLWEWTSSSYLPYPGFKPLTGALGEYNGKFMNAQRVLRGGSCLTPASHIRTTYRNFLQPNKRWQVAGIRLADNL